MRVITQDPHQNDTLAGLGLDLTGQGLRLMDKCMAKRQQKYSDRPWRSGMKEMT
jgi:hypothetical protein